MDEQIFSRAYLSERNRLKGLEAAQRGAGRDSHGLNPSFALDDWPLGYDSHTPPRSHIAAGRRARVDLNQVAA